MNNSTNPSAQECVMVLIVCFFAALSILFITMLAQDHIVRCYYMKTNITDAGLAYTVMGDINWADDVVSFSTYDANKTLDVISKLKQCAANKE